MAWTDDRVATLTKLWADGLSASQIAKQLGGVTRNAVIGKVHRLGLSGRAKPSNPKRKTVTTAKVTKPKVKTTRAPSAPRTPRIIAATPPAPPPLDVGSAAARQTQKSPIAFRIAKSLTNLHGVAVLTKKQLARTQQAVSA